MALLVTRLRAGFFPFGHLSFVLRALQALRPCDPRTDASDHIFVLGIFLLLVVVIVLLLLVHPVVAVVVVVIVVVVVVVVVILLLHVVVGVEVGQLVR